MPKRTASYEDWLVESLKNPVKAAAYLDEHFASEEEDADELLLLALRDVRVPSRGIPALALWLVLLFGNCPSGNCDSCRSVGQISAPTQVCGP